MMRMDAGAIAMAFWLMSVYSLNRDKLRIVWLPSLIIIAVSLPFQYWASLAGMPTTWNSQYKPLHKFHKSRTKFQIVWQNFGIQMISFWGFNSFVTCWTWRIHQIRNGSVWIFFCCFWCPDSGGASEGSGNTKGCTLLLGEMKMFQLWLMIRTWRIQFQTLLLTLGANQPYVNLSDQPTYISGVIWI